MGWTNVNQVSATGGSPFYDQTISVTQDNITIPITGRSRIRFVAEIKNANGSTIQQRLELRDASHATINSMVMLDARVNSGTGGAKNYSSTFPWAFLGAVNGLTLTIDGRLFVGTGRAKGADGKEIAISQLDPSAGGTIYDDSYSLICTDTTTAVNELYFFGFNGGVITGAIGAGSRFRVWDD